MILLTRNVVIFVVVVGAVIVVVSCCFLSLMFICLFVCCLFSPTILPVFVLATVCFPSFKVQFIILAEHSIFIKRSEVINF